MNRRRIFELSVDLPFLKKGTHFVMYDSTGNVFWIDSDKVTEYPLRTPLAGYLWLVATEPKLMKLLYSEDEDEYE